MGGRGWTHEHHGKGIRPWVSITWRRNWSFFFLLGGTAFRCSSWNWSKSSRVSHGKRKTRRSDENVTLWRVPLASWLSLGGLGLLWIYNFVPSVDLGSDLWLSLRGGIADIRLESMSHSPSSHHPTRDVTLEINKNSGLNAPAVPLGPICSFPLSQDLWLPWLSSDVNAVVLV